MKEIKIGLIGAGFIGTFISGGFYNIRKAYGTDVVPVFEAVAEPVEALAKKAQDTFGYKKIYKDWHDLINDKEVNIVIVATPNNTHRDIAIAAAKAGKNIFCEKPLSISVDDSREIAEAVEKAGVISLTDFIYTKCPVQEYAKDMIDDGKLGEIVSFRAEFDCLYCADPKTPMTWRQYSKLAGTGALGDLTSHLVALSDMLVGSKLGKIKEVCAVWDTPYTQRIEPKTGEMATVDTDDQIYILLKYENGRIGQMSSSRIVHGKGCSMGYEVEGSKGTIKYNVQRLNELQYADADSDAAQVGFKTIDGNPKHGEYANFSAMGALGVSYAEIMCMQAHKLLKAVAENKPVNIDIPYGYYVERVCGAMEKSAREKRWVAVDEIR